MLLTRRAFIATAAFWPGVAAFCQTLGEARVKARLAVTLARYTQWPATTFVSPADPLLLCLVHRSDTVTPAFAELAGQSVSGRPIKVLDNGPVSAGGCHMVFVHESAERDATAVLAAVAAQPVMTISDSDGFAARGGMVELANVNDAIRLDINLKSLRAARLELSSQVLKLARQVRE